MAIDYKQAEAAQAAAEAASQAAQNAKDAAEIQFLDGVRHLKEIRAERTPHEIARLSSRYISVFGLQKWTELCARSR
jgi:hypothetical protein